MCTNVIETILAMRQRYQHIPGGLRYHQILTDCVEEKRKSKRTRLETLLREIEPDEMQALLTEYNTKLHILQEKRRQKKIRKKKQLQIQQREQQQQEEQEQEQQQRQRTEGASLYSPLSTLPARAAGLLPHRPVDAPERRESPSPTSLLPPQRRTWRSPTSPRLSSFRRSTYTARRSDSDTSAATSYHPSRPIMPYPNILTDLELSSAAFTSPHTTSPTLPVLHPNSVSISAQQFSTLHRAQREEARLNEDAQQQVRGIN